MRTWNERTGREGGYIHSSPTSGGVRHYLDRIELGLRAREAIGLENHPYKDQRLVAIGRATWKAWVA